MRLLHEDQPVHIVSALFIYWVCIFIVCVRVCVRAKSMSELCTHVEWMSEISRC